MVNRAVLFFVVAIPLIVGCTPSPGAKTPYFHNNAAKEFFGYIKAGSNLKANGKDVNKVFEECFVPGLAFAEVEDILATATKHKRGEDFYYSWVFNCEIDGHVDGFVLNVVFQKSTSDPGQFVIKERYGTTLPS
jgi:hypothetical protein